MYREAGRVEKGRLLDEVCRVTGYHRKYAVRRLNGPAPESRPPRRRLRGPSYGKAVDQALRVVWEAANYPWSVRLKALLPLWLPWLKKRLSISPRLEGQLLRISPRQIDRRLKPYKVRAKRRLYGRTKPGTLLKHQIPDQGGALGREPAGLHRDRPGVALGGPRGRGVHPHAEPD